MTKNRFASDMLAKISEDKTTSVGCSDQVTIKPRRNKSFSDCHCEQNERYVFHVE